MIKNPLWPHCLVSVILPGIISAVHRLNAPVFAQKDLEKALKPKEGENELSLPLVFQRAL